MSDRPETRRMVLVTACALIDPDGRVLPHEIERWDAGGDSSSVSERPSPPTSPWGPPTSVAAGASREPPIANQTPPPETARSKSASSVRREVTAAS